ncbi:MAG: hypothetical protein OEM26_05415, partial [Saprospiraceae bacterium]|nr:hypothetical protein [Saprospiraceae bacterium]
MKKMTSLCLALVTGIALSTLVAQTLPVSKAVPVSKDSVAPPATIPLRGELAEYDAHPNVHPVGPTTSRRLPSNLKMVTPGRDGVPGPRTIEATFKKIPVRYTQPVTVEEPQVQREALYTTRYLTEDEGLKASTITSLLEDSRGHLWIAADQGGNVCRHDGERIICFSQEEGFPLTWGIRTMLEDRQGRIWFSGERGVCYYDGHHFWHYERTGATGWENVASGLLEDRHGNIWFNYGGDIHCYSGNEFTIYEQDALPMAGSLLEDRHGNIWISSWGHGVMRFNGKQVVYITEEDGLVDNHIGNMMETSTGELWFTNNRFGLAEAKGVSRFIPDGEQTGLPTGTLINYTTESGLSGNRIVDMGEDRDGRIWLSTWNDGITRFDAGLPDGQG